MIDAIRSIVPLDLFYWMQGSHKETLKNDAIVWFELKRSWRWMELSVEKLSFSNFDFVRFVDA